MPVTSVTDLIDLLAARRQASILHDRRTGMPYSWSHWLRTRVSRAMSAFARDDVAGAMAARPAKPRESVPAPRPFWQSMLLLLWQGADPPPRDQRGLRWFSAFFSVALHVLFALLLLWVALVRSNMPEEAAEDGERVQVQYIGRGTPEQEGGGMPQAAGEEAAGAEGAQAAAAAAAVASPAPTVASEPAAVEQPTPSEQVSSAATASAEAEADYMPIDASKPSPDAVAAQPVQVTETAQPVHDYQLPAVTVRQPNTITPALSMPELQVRERSVETVVERPQVTQVARQQPTLQPQLKTPEVQVRERRIETAPQQQVAMAQVRSQQAQVRLPSTEVAVRERQIEAMPRQAVAMAQVPSRAAQVQLKSADAPQVRERSVPAVSDISSKSTTSTATATATKEEAGAAAARGAAAPGARNAPTTTSTTPGSSPGAGPKPEDRSGGWAAPARSDDWGASRQQVAGNAGGQADNGRGLFNADGSVRLAGDGQAQQESKRGAPGGDADSWSRERIDQSGTWLKRPPYEHTPTSFDKYWVPNESLLAEWVRKGIKSIEIPIPGTGSKISCVVSMLQFGGGCGLTNPNMQEQPAEARPPPDIPFKKELQEDNGSR